MGRNKATIITFYGFRKFAGTPTYANGGSIPGKQSSFDALSIDVDQYENLMEVQSVFFNNVISGYDLEKMDFSSMMDLISRLHPRYNAMAAFLLDTITTLNETRIIKQNALNLAQQLNILNDEYTSLQKEYNYLKEHCDESKEVGETDARLTFSTNVLVDMDLVYTLYQHFFGYPEDGVWDEEKSNLIRKILQKEELITETFDGRPTKIRQPGDIVKIETQEADGSTLLASKEGGLVVGDTIIDTNHMILWGVGETYKLKVGHTAYPEKMVQFS